MVGTGAHARHMVAVVTTGHFVSRHMHGAVLIQGRRQHDTRVPPVLIALEAHRVAAVELPMVLATLRARLDFWLCWSITGRG